jgi:hypothetical protein
MRGRGKGLMIIHRGVMKVGRIHTAEGREEDNFEARKGSILCAWISDRIGDFTGLSVGTRDV